MRTLKPTKSNGLSKTTQSLERSRDFTSWLSVVTTRPPLSKAPPTAFMKLANGGEKGRMGPLILPSFSRNWKMFPTGRHTKFVSYFQDLGLPMAVDPASDQQSLLLFPTSLVMQVVIKQSRLSYTNLLGSADQSDLCCIFHPCQ